jgi:hypothetical protein
MKLLFCDFYLTDHNFLPFLSNTQCKQPLVAKYSGFVLWKLLTHELAFHSFVVSHCVAVFGKLALPIWNTAQCLGGLYFFSN